MDLGCDVFRLQVLTVVFRYSTSPALECVVLPHVRRCHDHVSLPLPQGLGEKEEHVRPLLVAILYLTNNSNRAREKGKLGRKHQARALQRLDVFLYHHAVSPRNYGRGVI